MRLLLVEDDVMVASGIKLGLSDAGYAVDWVGSAERALFVIDRIHAERASVSRQLVRAPQAADAAWGDGDLAGQPA